VRTSGGGRDAAPLRALTVAVALALPMVLAGCTPDEFGPLEASPAPLPLPGEPTDIADLDVGDCFSTAGTDDASTVRVLDCDRPHDREVYLSAILPDDASTPFPGTDALAARAVDLCLDGFEPFAGIDYDASTALDIGWFAPGADGWQDGDRRIDCAILRIDAEGSPAESVGSLQDVAE
jgi:hypothetical protein